jgi:molybdopterin/thiamine biosynthesis adenylyltransferase
VGGLGTNVALGLCRLGVQKIFLVDKDVVDAHNLNRQILFSKEDVGVPKVTRNNYSKILTFILSGRSRCPCFEAS